MFRDRSKLTQTVLWLLGAYLVTSCWGVISDILQLLFLRGVESGTWTGDIMAAADANDIRQQFSGYLTLAAFVVSGIASLVWTHRASSNARHLADYPQRISPGWAVGWYFVPIANLWKPYQSMAEIWRRSAFPPSVSGPAALGWWWALWIIGNITSQVALRASLAIDDLQSGYFATWALIVADALEIPTTLLYAWIINRVWQMQSAKALWLETRSFADSNDFEYPTAD